jgi:cbb3-type cytochrome oxidase subunit 3
LAIFDRAIMTILVWGILLEILSVIYLSPTPSRFEFAYSLFLLALTLIVLILMIWRLKRSTTKKTHASANRGPSHTVFRHANQA